ERVQRDCYPAATPQLLKALLPNGAEFIQVQLAIPEPHVLAAATVLLSSLTQCQLSRASGEWPALQELSTNTPQHLCDAIQPATPIAGRQFEHHCPCVPFSCLLLRFRIPFQ